MNNSENKYGGNNTIKNELLKSNLKVISRCGSGMNNIDIEFAESLGIKIYSCPDGPTQSVAELTIGCLLTLLRNPP